MQEPVYVLHLITCHGRIMPRLAELLFIWSFVAAHVTCSNSEWGYRDFLWTKGTPKYISQEQGNKPNFGKLELGSLENSSIRF